MILPVFPLILLVAAISQAEAGQPQIQDGKFLVNPLQRALIKLKDAYSASDNPDMCENNVAVKAECDVCVALDASLDVSLCCHDVSTLTSCHAMVEKVILDISSMQRGAESEPAVEADKRYGNLYGRVGKRYGNLYGRIGKRYGNSFGNILSNNKLKKSGEEENQVPDKRYGFTFSKLGKRDDSEDEAAQAEKRYGFTFSKLGKREE